jgi:endonuclease III
MVENRAQQILKILQENFTMPSWITKSNDPFKTLIVTIISQNTADRNTAKAFENLSNRFKITPEVLANAQTSQIEQSLKVAGLYRNKSKTIKNISRIILEKYHGTLTPILSLPLEEARGTLMELSGIGPKTADVVLLFCAEKPTVPVDTHVYRVSKRLDIAPIQGDYEAVRASLQRLFDPRDYLAVHVLLIQHGRKYCKARNPLCRQCPVNELCPSRNMCDKSD